MQKQNRHIIFGAIFLTLAFLPGVQAVVPAPDGCYPNFTTAEGCNALNSLTTGAVNTGVGWYSLFSNSTGNFNTGVGGATLLSNTGDENTAVGAGTLLSNTTGTLNTAVGAFALFTNADGSDNNAVGNRALFTNVSGTFNNAHGRSALSANDGSENNAFGDLSMENNTSGSSNTAIGDDALRNNVDGSGNVAVGDEAGTGLGPSVNNCIAIGAPGDGIQPMNKASETLYQFKPVTFKYNGDWKGTTQYGLIAEEVAEVDPQLVVRGRDGEIMAVHYEQISNMLLNEFLKEHKKVEELQATVAQQQKGMEVLTAQLKEQAAQIQKVSAQLEMSKPAAKVVVNKP